MHNEFKISYEFFSCSEVDLYSKALHLSNLCYLSLKQNEMSATKLLEQIANECSSEQLSEIAFKLEEASNKNLIDCKQQEAVNLAREYVLVNRAIAQKLSTKAITLLGQDPELCRLAIYNLITLANKDFDINFPLELIRIGSEQSAEHVSKLYAKAKVLPEELLNLASSSDNISTILADISEHVQRFSFTEHLIQANPVLADRAIKEWTQLLSCNELSKAEKGAINNVLERLSKNDDRFLKLLKIKRVKRSEGLDEANLKGQANTHSFASVLSLGWGACTAPRVLLALKTGATGLTGGGALIPSILLFAGPILGANALQYAYDTSFRRKIASEPKETKYSV